MHYPVVRLKRRGTTCTAKELLHLASERRIYKPVTKAHITSTWSSERFLGLLHKVAHFVSVLDDRDKRVHESLRKQEDIRRIVELQRQIHESRRKQEDIRRMVELQRQIHLRHHAKGPQIQARRRHPVNVWQPRMSY